MGQEGQQPSQDPYSAYGDYGGDPWQGEAPSTSRLPEGFEIDPEVIREQLKQFAALLAPLKVLDDQSENEQRAWVMRRSDNRAPLLRVVQKQFEDEMAFVKGLAVEEKAAKTSEAIDELVGKRKARYDLINEGLREQRRQAILGARDTTATARGRAPARGGRAGRAGADAGAYTGATQDIYGTTPARAPRRPETEEPEEPEIDPDTQAQVEVWLNTQPGDKGGLLDATHELDVIEYAALHELSREEEAARTAVAVMALLMHREQRIKNIDQKWQEEEERLQRLQQRMTPGQGGQPGMQPGGQPGPRRGRR